MINIKSEIIRASKVLKINVLELSSLQSKEILNQISINYANGKRNRFLWENFVEQIGVNDKNAWRWIKDFIGNKETIMFFNVEDEQVAFRFSNGEDVEAILGETFGFEFYLTNKTFDYVLCFNHHDILIACGSAVLWLRKYLQHNE